MKDYIKDSTVMEFLEKRKLISKNKRWGLDLPEKEFIKGMIFLNPQSYGPRVENFIKEKLGFKKVKPKDNRGDFHSASKFYELKISFLTSINTSLNMVQIRLWQDINYYICVAYDVKDISKYKKYIFLLTHDEMVKETKSATAAHGTKKINKENKNVELRFSFNCTNNDKTFVRWKNKYLVKDYESILEIV